MATINFLGHQRQLKLVTNANNNGEKCHEFLRTSTSYPIPSYRSLCKCVENMPISPGIQHDLMELVQNKTQSMCEENRDCAFLVDEVQLEK